MTQDTPGAVLDDVAARFLPRFVVAFLAIVGLLFLFGLLRNACPTDSRDPPAGYERRAGGIDLRDPRAPSQATCVTTMAVAP